MEREAFDTLLSQNEATISEIRDLAHKIHASVNQHYDKIHPYSIHLDSAADYALKYAHLVCDNPDDVVPIAFGAYFHDSIEDARLTYNNVMHLASKLMDDRQAKVATEIVYALTNEKGRTRAERANEAYYQGIRNTPYAPLCKLADRLANVSYSYNNTTNRSDTMRHVYAVENPHFIESVVHKPHPDDIRYSVPQQMIQELADLLR